MSTDRTVSFTQDEVRELTDFLRKFEASPKANDLLQKFSMRAIYANLEDLDGPDDEPTDTSNRFSNIRAYPGMTGFSVQTVDLRVLEEIAAEEVEQGSRYARMHRATWPAILPLIDAGYAEKHPDMDYYVKTTAKGRAALDDAAVLNTEEPSA